MNIALDSLNTNSVSYKTDEDFLYLVDLSDIHVGNMYHNEKVFKKWIKTIQGIPNMRVIIGGDSTDNASTHSASSPYEELLHGGDHLLKIRFYSVDLVTMGMKELLNIISLFLNIC